MKKLSKLVVAMMTLAFGLMLSVQVNAGGQAKEDFIVYVYLMDGNTREQIEPQAKFTADVQAGDGEKETCSLVYGTSENGYFYDQCKYFTIADTSSWTAGTIIKVSNVYIPEGYVEEEPSGEYTYTVTQNNIDYFSDETKEDCAQEIMMYVYVHKASEAYMLTEDNTGVDIGGLSYQDTPGVEVRPEDYQIIRNGKRLSPDNYDVIFSNNTMPGEATLTVTGKNGYSGTRTATYRVIGKADSSNTKVTVDKTGFVIDGEKHIPQVTSVTINGQKIEDSDIYIADEIYQYGTTWHDVGWSSRSDAEKQGAGTYTMYVVVASSYYFGYIPVTYQLAVTAEELTTQQETTTSPTTNAPTTNSPTINSPTTNNPTTNNPTTNNLTTSNATTVAAPAKASVAKIQTKKKSAKKLVMSVKKITDASGYEVQISKAKKFTGKNIIATKTSKKTKITVTSKKLSNKSKLYVRTRAYVLNGKKKVYGRWSVIKVVKSK